MKWDDLSNNTKACMQLLGDFKPTVVAKDRMVKGFAIDHETGGGGKIYHSSEELREIAEACIEVADWLDKRASEDNANA